MKHRRLPFALVAAAMLLGPLSTNIKASTWQESNESGEEVDAPLPPLPSKPLYRGTKPLSSGTDLKTRQRRSGKVRQPRPEKQPKPAPPREYLD
jgi:hypothetical protein